MAQRQAYLKRRSAKSTPMTLPDEVGKALLASVSDSGLVRAVPVDVKSLHAGQKCKAASHLRELMKNWMESDQGNSFKNDAFLF